MARGEIAHVEFPADDPDRAMRFYGAVAGWEFGSIAEFPDYHLFSTGERTGGAVGLRGRTTGGAIRLYIAVDSLEDACAAAEANGGTVMEPPTAIGGGMGRFAVLRDPEGSEIGIWQGEGEGAG